MQEAILRTACRPAGVRRRSRWSVLYCSFGGVELAEDDLKADSHLVADWLLGGAERLVVPAASLHLPCFVVGHVALSQGAHGLQ